jgi:soluble lytic murein transglycosylase
MPTVPTYETQVTPHGLPDVRVQGVASSVAEAAQSNARITQQVGQDMVNFGTEGVREAAREQMMANQVRVDSALNDVRAAQQKLTYDPADGYLQHKGAAAVQPSATGQGLQEQYGEKLQSTISSASQALGNDAQRQVFATQARQLATQFDGHIQSHVLQEYKAFGLETQKGTIELAGDTAMKNWSNPDLIDSQIESVKAAVWKAGQINGDPANLVEAKTLQTVSKVHFGVVEAALQNNNPEYAQKYIQQYKGDMTAGDLLKASGQIRSDISGRVATSAAQTAMMKYNTAFQPTASDRMLQITQGAESKGQDFKADGTTALVSSAGAKYKMQVMPDTAKDPGFGIKPAESDTPAEYNRVGTELLGALVKKYAGDSAKTWAAYNAGAGNVDKAIADAGPNGDWMAALAKYQSKANHDQTVNYVKGNVAQLQGGGGSPAIPSLQDIHNNIREQLGTNPDPTILAKALAEGSRQYHDAVADRKTQGDNAVMQAQQFLAQNGGDYTSLPQALQAQVVALAPDKLVDLQTYAKNIANPPKADNMGAYHTAIEHPDELAKMPDAQFHQFMATNFSETTQKQIAKLRQDALTGKLDASAGGLDSKTLVSELSNRLTSLGIEAKPTASDTKGRERVGAIQKYLTDSIFAQQQQLGRKMTAQEITQHVDQKFLKDFTFRNTVLGVTLPGTYTIPYLKMQQGDIPSDQVDQIKQALAKQGNASPTPDQIMRTYWARKAK